jgi:acyl-coenzyme A synthetase/AMP-(fatty) acid ligase
MVLLRPDGTLVPIGRADRQVKINGIRVEPAETEAALRTLPHVADAAVIVYGDPDAPVLLAFVVPMAREAPAQLTGRGADALMRGWRSALVRLLPPQQVPARMRVVPGIPLLPSLKPDIAALRALARQDSPGLLARISSLLRRARLRGFARGR